MADVFGHYELIRPIGVGGMAEVWLARDTRNDEICALKRILPHHADEDKFIEMFLDEARLAAQLKHKNIPKIYESGKVNKVSYIAMEYIDGSDLADVLDTIEGLNYKIPIGVAVEIVIRVLDALSYAHRLKENGKPLNIVHRDISPHNILLSQDGDVRLVDFGVAMAVERHAKTETGVIKGKLSYMSPEQIQQEDLDARADLFSLGVVLFELLTEETPFGRELKAVGAILNNPTPNPTELRPSIPAELSEVIMRALEKDPDKRFDDARTMASALRDIKSIYYVDVGNEKISRVLRDMTNEMRSTTREYEAPNSNTSASKVIIPEPSKDRSKWVYVFAVLLVIGIIAWIYQVWSSKPDAEETKTIPQPELVFSTEETEVETEFSKLLRQQDKIRPRSEISPEQMKRILSYRIGHAPDDYLLSGKVKRYRVSTQEGEEPKDYVDPGNPEARFDLRLSKEEYLRRKEEKLVLKKLREEERKRLRKVNRLKKIAEKKAETKRLKKEREKKKRDKRRKRKRKDRMVDKVVPGGI